MRSPAFTRHPPRITASVCVMNSMFTFFFLTASGMSLYFGFTVDCTVDVMVLSYSLLAHFREIFALSTHALFFNAFMAFVVIDISSSFIVR